MDRQMRRRVAVLAAVAVTLAACSTRQDMPAAGATPAASPVTSTPPGGAPGRTDVAVTLRDFAVTSMPASAPAGRVTFVVRNAGPSPHEFVLVKSDLPVDALPQVNQKVVDPAAVEVIARTEPFDSGGSRDVVVTLGPGRYVAICNIPSHYVSGMYAGFTVLP